MQHSPSIPGRTRTNPRSRRSGVRRSLSSAPVNRPRGWINTPTMDWQPRRKRWSRKLVSEMPSAGKEHGDIVSVAGGDHVIVIAAAARLDDSGDSRPGGQVEAVAEGEKCIRRQGRPDGALLRFVRRD